jgi:ubiquinone/menaquinone biosynthesis C-methylase UbiE
MGVDVRFGTALDFGCGVGRLTRALSDRFERVVGVDISASMLEEARAQHRDLLNLELLHNLATDLGPVPSDTIDLVYSNIVLQHMPARRQVAFIGEFCRVLRPGGVAVFQTPSHQDRGTLTGWIHLLVGNRPLNIARRVLHGRHGVMEIHVLPRRKVLETLAMSRMSVVEIEPYAATGRGFVSFRYYAVKG